MQPGQALVIGYNNEETEIGHGIQFTISGDVLMGTWHGSDPWDVDIYHSNLKGELLFSQRRDGQSVPREKVERILLADNPFLKSMTVQVDPQAFYDKVSAKLKQIA